MWYAMSTDGDYIISLISYDQQPRFIDGSGYTEIGADEYTAAVSAFNARPIDGGEYKLSINLSWEQISPPSDDFSAEISDADALEIISGGTI